MANNTQFLSFHPVLLTLLVQENSVVVVYTVKYSKHAELNP